MDYCKGFKDWLECLNCPHLCTYKCPVEGKDAVEKMRTHIHSINLIKKSKEQIDSINK